MGWKAVAIGANTSQSFPQSMTIQGLQIASPVDSRNVLLMNFSGFERPLQTTSLSVGSNSSVVMQSSMLEVINTDTNGYTGNISLGATFSHGDYSQVKVHGLMEVGRFDGSGAYYLTNGTLSVNTGLYLGWGTATGTFVQYGGENNVSSMSFFGMSGGEYDLYGGRTTAT